MKFRLRKTDIPLIEVLQLSRRLYKGTVDDKAKRGRLDISGGRVTLRNNLAYNPGTKSWEQTGRELRIDFEIKTTPTSYVRQDTIRVHKYPVSFLIKDLSLGALTPFRWRTGSWKKPLFARAGLKKEKRISIANQNIKNGVQMQFFFELEQVLSLWGLLFGPNHTNKRLPLSVNPTLAPYFDKHAFFACSKLLLPFLQSPRRADVLDRMRKA